MQAKRCDCFQETEGLPDDLTSGPTLVKTELNALENQVTNLWQVHLQVLPALDMRRGGSETSMGSDGEIRCLRVMELDRCLSRRAACCAGAEPRPCQRALESRSTLENGGQLEQRGLVRAVLFASPIGSNLDARTSIPLGRLLPVVRSCGGFPGHDDSGGRRQQSRGKARTGAAEEQVCMPRRLSSVLA